jgi:hypothetical protein
MCYFIARKEFIRESSGKTGSLVARAFKTGR